jgi:hypothetical protein
MEHAVRAEGDLAMSSSKVQPTTNTSAPYTGFPWRLEVDFLGKDLSTHTILEDTVTIYESGVYSLWFVVCDPTLKQVCHLPTLLHMSGKLCCIIVASINESDQF